MNHGGEIVPVGIVLHSISEFIRGKYCIDFLNSLKFPLSAHAFVTPDGERIDAVPTNLKAYHAGVSEWKGMKNLNRNFLGVEPMVRGNRKDTESLWEEIKNPNAFSDRMYRTLVEICSDWMKKHPTIKIENVVTHEMVSGPHVRTVHPKYDIGSGFDFRRFRNNLIMHNSINLIR